MVVEKYVGLLSGIVIGAAQVIYLLNCLRKKITPSVLSWFGWACLMGTSVVSQVVSKGWQWSMTGILCSTVGCLAIAGVAFLSKNYSFKRGDLGFLVAGLGCVGIYVMSDNPWVTTVFAIVADGLLGIPTIRKAVKDPASERSAAWILGVVSSTLALGICLHHNIIYMLFPVYLWFFNGAMAGLTWGRKVPVLAVGVLISSGSVFAQGKPLYTFPLGVEAYTYRNSWPRGVAKTLDTIRMLGFTELEGGGGGAPQEFRKLCDERGIRIPSIGADYNKLVQHPDSIIGQAKILGAQYVMCAWIPHSDGVLTFENAKKAVEDFNRVGKLLSEAGLIFCYHAHGYEFQPYGEGTLLDYIIHNTDPRYVSFEMDIMWISFGGGDPVGMMKKYGDRWKLMHLKDLRKGAPKNLTGQTGPENDVPLGQGEEDIPAILKEAKKIGIRHYFIEDESVDPTVPVPQSIHYLRSLKS